MKTEWKITFGFWPGQSVTVLSTMQPVQHGRKFKIFFIPKSDHCQIFVKEKQTQASLYVKVYLHDKAHQCVGKDIYEIMELEMCSFKNLFMTDIIFKLFINILILNKISQGHKKNK